MTYPQTFGYAGEKLESAVDVLAVGTGSIQERLYNASVTRGCLETRAKVPSQ